MRFPIAIFLAVISVSSGCSPSLSGGPDLSGYESFSRNFFESGYGQNRVTAYDQASDPYVKKSLRDSIVLSAIGSIDTRYTAYERTLTREGQQLPFITSLASISLSGAGTLVAGAAAKTTLAAVDTGLKGAKAAYDKDILAEKTVQFLQKQMRTNRNKVKTEIISKLALDVGRYPLEMALIDVEDYAAAGTVTSGLVAIDEQTSKALAASEEQKITLISTYGPDDASKVIRQYIASGSAASDRINDWLANCKHLDIKTGHLMAGKEYVALRQEVIRAIEASGQGEIACTN
ncbi:hypothetical protein [Rhizobium sp. PAMB 3182]